MKVLIGFPKMGVEIPSTTQSHPELVSGSHCEPIIMLLRGQILNQVQDDHLLWAIAICYIVRNGRAGVPPKQKRSWPSGGVPTETETNVKNE